MGKRESVLNGARKGLLGLAAALLVSLMVALSAPGTQTALAVDWEEEASGGGIASSITLEEAAASAELTAQPLAASDQMVDALVVPVRYDYNYAYRVLDLVNQERQKAGLDRLTMDKDLLEAAMERAVECSYYYDHVRPDGTQCFTICPQKMNAENIAAGYTTPDEVVNGWMNSPGHRANILREGEKSIGIGCVYTGEYWCPYWVQCFGTQTATPVSNPGNSTAIVRCALPESWLTSNNFTFNYDEYYLLPGEEDEITPLFINQGASQFYCVLDPSTFSWSSSNSSVARVTSAGVVTGGARGKATVTASIGSYMRVGVPVYVDSQQGYWYSYGSGRWRFYLMDGSYAKGWGYIEGDWYYFDSQGWMKTGWQLIGGSYYYLNSSGRMVTGWQKVGSDWYYLKADGRMAKYWLQLSDGTYYLNGSGQMMKGWQYLGGSYFYFDGSGRMVTGWQKLGSIWYYFKGGGHMATGLTHLDDGTYYFNSSGEMVKGWKSIGGSWYFFDGSGRAAKGWKSLGGSWYFFDDGGRALTGWQLLGGSWFYMNSSGQAQTGWKYLGGSWFYFGPAGHMKTNCWIDGLYWVGEGGHMATNAWVDGGNYYVGADGKWVKGVTK